MDKVYQKPEEERSSRHSNRQSSAIIVLSGLLTGVLILCALLLFQGPEKENSPQVSAPERNPAQVTSPAKTTEKPVETVHGHGWIPATFEKPKTCRTCGLEVGLSLARPSENQSARLSAGNYHSVLLIRTDRLQLQAVLKRFRKQSEPPL